MLACSDFFFIELTREWFTQLIDSKHRFSRFPSPIRHALCLVLSLLFASPFLLKVDFGATTKQQNIRHSDFRYSLSLTHTICHMIGILITIQHTTRLICGNVFGNPIRNPWTTYVATHPPPSPYNTPPALLSHKHGHRLACPTPIVCHFERKVWTASLQVSSPTVIK